MHSSWLLIRAILHEAEGPEEIRSGLQENDDAAIGLEQENTRKQIALKERFIVNIEKEKQNI